MENILDQQEGVSKVHVRDFFKNVYAYMFGALIISGVMAHYTGTEEFVSNYYINAEGTGLSMTYYLVAFAPLGLVFLISGMLNRASFGLLLFLYMLYSVLMGMSLGVILLMYTQQAIATTFFVTAGAFGAMAILGYTTKTDLTKMGSLLYMALIGIIIAGFVNWFVQSEAVHYLISMIGVFVFTGLTAYSMQQMKAIATDTSLSHMQRSKLALMGGLNLYILFVNLFLSLLSLLGGRD